MKPRRANSRVDSVSCLLACCLIAPYKGNEIRSAPAARGGGAAAVAAWRGCPAALLRALPARLLPVPVVHRALLGCHQVSIFRFLALGLVLAYPGLPERSQRRSTNAQLAAVHSLSSLSFTSTFFSPASHPTLFAASTYHCGTFHFSGFSAFDCHRHWPSSSSSSVVTLACHSERARRPRRSPNSAVAFGVVAAETRQRARTRDPY
jgi:hypothetical protein